MTEKEFLKREITKLADALEKESENCPLSDEELSKMGDIVWDRLKQQININDL